MKLALLIASMLLVGCSNEKVDTKFLCEDTISIDSVECTPVPCEQTINGYLDDEWMERIDAANVKLNHYVDEVKIEENIADVVDVNGNIATSNPITIPEYIGEPMKHILIIEFWQVK